VLTSLGLGHTALNMTLKMIGKHQTGPCDGCGEEESVDNVMVNCKVRNETQRKLMRKNLKELGLRECTLKGILSMSGRAHSTASSPQFVFYIYVLFWGGRGGGMDRFRNHGPLSLDVSSPPPPPQKNK